MDGPDKTADSDDGTADDSERVEQAFQQWGQRIGRFVSAAAARAREEAEDIVAEAQSIRRGESD